jgi:tetratricopeptide (TPR) repeat protein
MGRKQNRAGKYIHLHIACIIFLSLFGCVHFEKIEMDLEEKEARHYLHNGQELFVQGDYEGALNENQRVLSLSAGAHLADEALFNMGLIYAHPGNPKRDYGKSLGFFRKLVKDYLHSSLVEQAKVWIGVLEENTKLNQTIDKLNQMIEKLKQIDLEESTKLNQTIDKLNHMIEMIEKLKQIDLEVEEKRREKVK